jgi:hypothetical protein
VTEPFWLRHDLPVVGAAVAVLLAAWLFRAEALAPAEKHVQQGHLVATVPASWLATPHGDSTLVQGEDAITGVELRVVERPGGPGMLDATLELARGQRYGELYQRLESGRSRVGSAEALRTVYAYAFKPTPTHAPRVATAVEVAFPVEGEGPLYVVTLRGEAERVRELEPRVLGTLEVLP